MHQLKVLILGPASFIGTLNELEPFLKFNPVKQKNSSDFDIILFHEEALKDKEDKKIIENSNCLKIYSSDTKNSSNNFDAFLKIPSFLKEINLIVENVAAKKEFSKNSNVHMVQQRKSSLTSISLSFKS